MTIRTIIGVAGLVCAGKSTFTSYIADRWGAYPFSFRSLFEERLQKRGIEVTREALDALSSEYRRTHGEAELFRYAESVIGKKDLVVLDSVRSPRSVRWFASRDDSRVHTFYVEADFSIRCERLRQRAGDLSVESLSSYDADVFRGGLSELLKTCGPTRIDNSHDLRSFHQSIEQAVGTYI